MLSQGQFCRSAESNSATPLTAARQSSLSITNSWSLLKLMSSEFEKAHTIHPSHPLSSPSPPAFNLSQYQGFFPMSQFFTSGGQSIGVSALASVLPMNIQDWFPLGWTCWISLKSKGLSTVFSNTTVQKHKFFSGQVFFIIQLSHPYVTTGHDYSDPKLREK